MGDRRRARFGWTLGIVAVGAVIAGADDAEGQGTDAIVIDFEAVDANPSGRPAATTLTDQYRELGVTFDPATPIVYDEASIPSIPGFARSGSNVVTTCYGEEFCTTPIAFEFDEPVESAGVWVGYTDPLAETATIEATAIAADGTLVTSAAVLLGPSEEPTPVALPLFVADPRGRISRVVVRWSDPDRSTDGIAVDDLEFTPFVERREITAEPGALDVELSDAPDDRVITFTNTGNIDVPSSGASLLVADPRLAVVDDGCVGVIAPDDRCEVVLRFESDGSREQIATTLVLRDRAGAPVSEVRVLAVPVTTSTETSTSTITTISTTTTSEPPPDTTGTTADPTTTLGPRPATTTATTAGGTIAGGGSGDGRDRIVVDPGGGGAGVVLVVVAIAIAGWAIARRRGERPDGPPTTTAPLVRPRTDPGRQTTDPAPPALASALRARWSLDRTAFVLPEPD